MFNYQGLAVRTQADVTFPGLQVGDHIIGVNGLSVKDANDVYLAVTKEGGTIKTIDVIRFNRFLTLSR